MKDRFVSYKFRNGVRYDLNETLVHAKERVKDVDGVTTTVTLTAVLVTLHTTVSRIDLAPTQQDYDEYLVLSGDHVEAHRVRVSRAVDFNALFDKDP